MVLNGTIGFHLENLSTNNTGCVLNTNKNFIKTNNYSLKLPKENDCVYQFNPTFVLSSYNNATPFGYTYEMWVYIDTSSTNATGEHIHILHIGDDVTDTLSHMILLDKSTNKFKAIFKDNNTGTIEKTYNTVLVDQWVHIAYTQEENIVYIHINQNLFETTTLVPPTNQHTVPGRVAIGGTSAFGGVAMKYDLYVDNIKLHARPKYATNGTIDNTISDIFINENLTKVRNNALLSYILCIMILLFVGYMIYTIFF